MGKRKCIELREVKVDFVSFVPRGANGEPFAIFKSADYTPPEAGAGDGDGEGEEVRLENLQRGVEPTQRTTVELSREDTGVLKRVFGFLFGKRGNQEEGAMSTETKKAIEALTGEVTRMSAGVEKALAAMKGNEQTGEGDDKGNGEGTPDAPATPPAEGGEAADAAAAGNGSGAADAGSAGDGAAGGSDGSTDRPEVEKDAAAISALRDEVKGLTEKIVQLEKGRLPETGVEREGEVEPIVRDGKRQRPSFKKWI